MDKRQSKMTGAFFLDRDGTVIEDAGYLSTIEGIRLLPGAVEALRLIRHTGWPAVVVTNQSGVGRGIFPEERVKEIHDELQRRLKEHGVQITAFYYCPHHPEAKLAAYREECLCRKPSPGMLKQAAKELSLDLTRSYVVGDTLRDVEAGRSAGCRTVLLETGKGAAAVAALGRGTCSERQMPHNVAPDLLAGVRWILEKYFEPRDAG